MTEAELRKCKRCLIRDLDEGELFASIKEYVASLDPYLRVSDEEYEKRLQICGTCDKLLSGMCRICGCYVEMRAAGLNKHCPDINEKW